VIDLESDTLKRMHRRKARLGKKSTKEYITTPKLENLGYEIIAFSFVKSRKEEHLQPEKCAEAAEKARAWCMKQPNVIFASVGEGLEFDRICVSLHKSYSEFVQFIRKHDTELSSLIVESQSFIAEVNPRVVLKPFNLKCLAEAK